MSYINICLFLSRVYSKFFFFAEFPSVQGFPDEQELLKVLANKTYENHYFGNGGWRGVVFLNTNNNETKPAKVMYKIRDVNQWSTQLLFPDSPPPGPFRGGNLNVSVT